MFKGLIKGSVYAYVAVSLGSKLSFDTLQAEFHDLMPQILMDLEGQFRRKIFAEGFFLLKLEWMLGTSWWTLEAFLATFGFRSTFGRLFSTYHIPWPAFGATLDWSVPGLDCLPSHSNTFCAISTKTCKLCLLKVYVTFQVCLWAIQNQSPPSILFYESGKKIKIFLNGENRLPFLL